MLTEKDGRTDGNKTKYLSQPGTWRKYDAELYDFLRHRVIEKKLRHLAQVEDESILPNCVFYSEVLRDNLDDRTQYIDNFKKMVHKCDLLFFDADNGMEVQSTPSGRKNSSKYLYWNEVKELYNQGYSILVFQYHRRIKYEDFLLSLSVDFKVNIGVRPINYYHTPHVTLILLAQQKHRPMLRKVNKAIAAHWQEQINIIPVKYV